MPGILVDKQLKNWYPNGNIYVEVVDLSKTKYPNRDALRKAHDIYLDAMYQFVKRCLDKVQGTTAEELIRDALGMSPHDDVEEKIEISDIAHLVRTYWYDSFEAQFEVIDRYYEARSVVGLMVEGRNRASHPPWDLDREFTRTHLFLIAELLGKINRPEEQREVETIQDDLFSDGTAEQLENTSKQLKKVKAENAKYKKSITEVEKRLASTEESNKELSKQIVDNAVKLSEKKEELEKLSERLVAAKLSEKEYEKQLNSTSKQLEKAQAVHTACDGHLTTISNQLASTEAERDASKERLVVIQKLLTAATISDQSVFPPLQTDSTVRILDRRDVDKRDYLLKLLEQKQPTLIYVQSEEMVNKLLTLVGSEKADVIGRHDEQTSEAEETEILEKLESGELIAIVSNTTFPMLTSSHSIEHFVFCHLVPGLDTFFERCQLAFTSEKNNYLHLIYDSKQDIEGLTQKYPDRAVLEKLYPELKKHAETNGNFIKTENLYSELDIVKLGIETGTAIFEELQLLERNEEGINLLPPAGKKLDESEIYRKGEKLKKETVDFQTFQLEHSIEQIWEKMLEKLNVDSEQILRENSIHKIPSRISETEGDYLKDSQTQSEQPTELVEKDSGVSDETAEAPHTPKPPRANAKVTEEQVRKIRSRSAAGETYSGLAKEFGLTSTGIRNIVLRNTWKHVE